MKCAPPHAQKSINVTLIDLPEGAVTVTTRPRQLPIRKDGPAAAYMSAFGPSGYPCVQRETPDRQ